MSSVFNGEGYGPLPLSDEECVVVAKPKGEMPRAVGLDVPDWLEPYFDGDDDYARLKMRAPIDLRVNLRKSNLTKPAFSAEYISNCVEGNNRSAETSL